MDEGGYELIRRKEERAVDLRQAGAAGPGTAAAVEAGIVRTARRAQMGGGGRENPFEVGDIVKYRGNFLRSVGWHTNVPKDGRVVGIEEGLNFPIVEWNDGHTTPVNPVNLQLAKQPDRDAGLKDSYGEVYGRRTAGPRTAGPSFLVSLLQTPDGALKDRKTLFSNQEMDAEGLERLVKELKAGPMTVTHDTWTDGEWEIRIRGPRGQLIHGYESVGPDEIGGAKGQTLLDLIEGIMSMSGGEDEGEGEEMAAPPFLPGAEEPPPEGAPPPEGEGAAPPGLPPPGPAAPSAAALTAGRRVLVVRQGQVADAVVMMFRPQEQALEVMFGGGEQEVIPMGDVIEPDLEIELEPHEGHDEGGSDEGGDGEDSLIEVSADDFGASPGGAGQDPFDVEVEPESEESPMEFGYGSASDDDGDGGDGDFERAASRYITARLERWGISFMSGFRPGAIVTNTRDLTPFYYGGKFRVPAGTVFEVEGFHRPGEDPLYGFHAVREPHPGADPFQNLRIRLVDVESGTPVMITVDELERDFEAEDRVAPGGEEEPGEMPGVPAMPGTTQVVPDPFHQRPPIQPERPPSESLRPPSMPGGPVRPTIPIRPPRGP